MLVITPLVLLENIRDMRLTAYERIQTKYTTPGAREYTDRQIMLMLFQWIFMKWLWFMIKTHLLPVSDNILMFTRICIMDIWHVFGVLLYHNWVLYTGKMTSVAANWPLDSITRWLALHASKGIMYHTTNVPAITIGGYPVKRALLAGYNRIMGRVAYTLETEILEEMCRTICRNINVVKCI